MPKSLCGSPETNVEGWLRHIPTMVWTSDAQVDRFARDVQCSTDDRPMPEYLLLRRLFWGWFNRR
jgi:hypothetical protein